MAHYADALTSPPLPRLGRAYTKYEPTILGVLGLVLFAGAWEGAARLGWLNPIVLSSPSQVGTALLRQWTSGDLPRDIQTSLLEFVIGFTLATTIGVGIGIAMGLHQSFEYALEPFVWFIYSAPMVAFYPLIVVWLGFGFSTVIAIVVLLTAIPITVNTVAGIHSVDPLLIRAVRAFGGAAGDVIFKVVLPASLPLVLAGLRIGLGRALIGVVLGEMFSANAGLGFRLTYYGARLRTTDVLVSLVVIVVIGILGSQLIRLLEHRFGGWRER